MRNGTMLAHLLLLGPASAGKSYSYQVILRLLPAGTYRVIDAGSPRVLIYDSADYKHRVLIYGEADSLPAGEDNPAASAIRNLLQDNRLHYEVVGKNPFTGEFGVQEVDKEGPTVLITTSTRPLGHQLGTRLFSLEVADNPNQVRAALQARAALEVGRAPEPDPVLVAFQEYLQLQAPWDVVVPFALLLAAEIGRTNAAARMNRDFQRLLSLIKAVTILRHARRERDDQGRLIATLDDYRAVRDRTNHMYEGTVSGASQQVREVVETVAALIAESTSPQTATVTAKEVGDRLGIDKSSASRRIRVALREDWLINQEDRRGRPQKLRVGEPLPNRRGLPVPEQLRGGEGTSSHGDDRNRATAPPTEDQPASAVSDDDCTVAGPTEDHGIPSSPDDDDGDDDGGGGDGGCAVAPTTESRDPSPSPAQTPTPATLSSPDVDVLSPTRHRLITTQSGLEEVLPDLLAAPMVGLDTETTGLDSRSDRLRVVQLATRDQTYIIDCFQVDPRVLAPVLEGARRFVGHNLKFDLGFLSAAGLPMPNGDRLFDTMLAAQLLGAGADEGRLQQCGLAAVVRRELGIDLDKGHQTSDWSGPLTDAQFAYAARDAATLPILAKLLGAQLTAAGLERVAEIEMGALPAITWLEQAGAPFDSPRWSYLADSARERARTLAGEIREILGIPINPNSHPQVKGALAELGIELDSTKEAALLALTDRHPVISKLLEHRQATKMGGAFGSRFLQYVDSETGRVHGDYLQIGAASGRMACSKPNLQNIPRDPAYRACFRPDSSRVLVKADYSQIELRIVAELTGEPRMLQAYRDGEDIHAVTAAAVLGRAGQSISSEDRQAAKSFNFGLIFGMGAPKLRGYALTNYGVSLTDVEAVEFRRRFLETYDGLREWHRSQPSDPVDTSTFAGRRRRGVSVFTEKLNTPVQGTAADGFKSALGLLWETRDRFPGAAPVLCVHDELVVECDRDQAEAVAAWVVECMTDGMQPFLPRVPVVVETKITGDWSGE